MLAVHVQLRWIPIARIVLQVPDPRTGHASLSASLPRHPETSLEEAVNDGIDSPFFSSASRYSGAVCGRRLRRAWRRDRPWETEATAWCPESNAQRSSIGFVLIIGPILNIGFVLIIGPILMVGWIDDRI